MIPGSGLMSSDDWASRDPYSHLVVFRTLFEGANGATNLVDSSNNRKVSTRNGGASLTTSGAVAGYSSCGTFDGTGDNWTYGAPSADYDFGTGQYTVEGLAKTATTSQQRFLISHRSASGADNGWFLYMDATGKLVWAVKNSDVTRTLITASVSLGTSNYFHYEANYDGTKARLFIEGVMRGSATPSGGQGASNGGLYIGSSSLEDGTRDWSGQMQMAKVTIGACRHPSDSNFTVPSYF
jgi:hypothetical protein